MAITKVTRTLLSTGIVDNSNATAITIDSSENVGIGTGSPSAPLDLAGNFIFKSPANTLYGNFDATTQAYAAFRLQAAGSSYGFIGQTSSLLASGGSNTALGLRSENEFVIATGGSTERMRIDASGVVDIKSGGTASAPSLIFEGDTNTGLFHGGDTLGFSTAGSERMRIDSSGKVHIGATSGTGLLNVDGGTGEGSLYVEGTSSGSPITARLLASDGGAVFFGSSTNHDLRIQTNGSNRMTITGAGNVGIGTTSLGTEATLHIGKPSSASNAEGGQLVLQSSTDGSLAPHFDAYTNASVDFLRILKGTDTASSALHSVFDLTNNRFGIGTSAPSADLEVYANAENVVSQITNNDGNFQLQKYQDDIYLNLNDNGNFIFRNYGSSGSSITERMRIDSSGDLLIGMTANDVAQQNGAFIQSANGRYFCSLGSNSLNTYHVYSTVNNSYNFYVNCSGTIYSTSTSISSLSDERLKENIVDIDTGLTEVMSLKPRKFDWKNGNGKDIKNDTGFIAQEVETVLPDLIGDFMHDDLEDAKAVRMGDMIPTLVKAIQELSDKVDNQQTIIDDLKTRIETLESA